MSKNSNSGLWWTCACGKEHIRREGSACPTCKMRYREPLWKRTLGVLFGVLVLVALIAASAGATRLASWLHGPRDPNAECTYKVGDREYRDVCPEELPSGND